MGIRSSENADAKALVIAARTTHVQNCRLRYFDREMSRYRKNGKDKLGPTKVMVVTFKMKHFYLKQKSASRGRGEHDASACQTHGGGNVSGPEIDDELTLMIVHMYFPLRKGTPTIGQDSG